MRRTGRTLANPPGSSQSLQLRLPAFRIDAPAVEMPPPADVPVERWESAEGVDAVAVLGWNCAGRLHFQFPGLARYVFEPAAFVCSAQAFAGASDVQLIDAYQRAVLPIILQSRGTELLHASAIDTDLGVVALAARSGTGKSTLAANFGSRGYRVWSDDAVSWAVEDGQVITASLPFVLRTGDSAGGYVPLGTQPSGAPRPLAALVIMERATSARDIRRITRSSAALSSVLPHAYCFSTCDSAANRALMSNYLNLIAAVPVYLLRFPAGLDGIAATIELLESTLKLRRPIESAARTACAE